MPGVQLLFPCDAQKSFVLCSQINKNRISRIVWYPVKGLECHFQKVVFSAIRAQRWCSLLRDDAIAPAGIARSPGNGKALTPFLPMSTRLICHLR